VGSSGRKHCGTGRTTLLNVLEWHPSRCASTVFALRTTKLLHDVVEVAPESGHLGVVGANGGLGDLQGPLVLGAGAGQVAQLP
jgi:hypothetical protein